MDLIRYFQKITHACGVIIRPYKPSTHPDIRLIRTLEHFNIDCALDVGANVGQFALMLQDEGFKGNIISFEPLSGCHKILMKKSAGKKRWTIYERCVIGAAEGETEINISENLVSSSVLDIKDLHIQGAASSRYIGKEKVKIKTLDRVVLPSPANNIFLKIDVQGYEMEVLKGAEELLKKTKVISIEMSLVPVYENNNILWQDIVKYMDERGFYLFGIQPGFTDNKTGQVYQTDGIFAKKEN